MDGFWKNVGRIFVLASLPGLASVARCEPLYLLGKIGDLPVAVTLEKKGEQLDGAYFYVAKAKQIRLHGALNADGVLHLDEAVNGVKTGLIDGTVKGKHWSGTWRKNADASPLPIELDESAKLLVGESADFRCATQDREKPYTYRTQTQLVLAQGKIKQFAAEQTVVGPQDEQQCSLELDDLEVVPSGSGILLRAESEPPGASGGHCSVRIVGNDRLLWIRFGESSRDGDDCRSAADTMFCSARAMWSDVVLDRQTQKCKIVK